MTQKWKDTTNSSFMYNTNFGRVIQNHGDNSRCLIMQMFMSHTVTMEQNQTITVNTFNYAILLCSQLFCKFDYFKECENIVAMQLPLK